MTVLLLAIVLACPSAYADTGPFDGLHAIEGVMTSRNGRWIRIAVSAEKFRARVPGYAQAVTPSNAMENERVWLSVECRAGPSTELFPESPAQAEIAIPDHPDQTPYNWWHPMFWILGLTGRETEKVPVTVSFTDDANAPPPLHTEKADLERWRTEYSAVRTLISVWLDGERVLRLLKRRTPLEVAVEGKDTHVEAAFAPAAHLAPAIERMLRYCPSAAASG